MSMHMYVVFLEDGDMYGRCFDDLHDALRHVMDDDGRVPKEYVNQLVEFQFKNGKIVATEMHDLRDLASDHYRMMCEETEHRYQQAASWW